MCNIPGKVDRLDILNLDKNWRLVDEYDAPLQWVDEPKRWLVGAGNSRSARKSYEVVRHSDLSVDQGFHHLGYQLKGGAAHLLLQLSYQVGPEHKIMNIAIHSTLRCLAFLDHLLGYK